MKKAKCACLQCKEIFNNYEELKKHQQHKRNDIVEICGICNVSIPPCVSKNIHFRTHPVCASCGSVFLTYDKFILHSVSCHLESVPKNLMVRSRSGGAICYVCGWLFRDSALTGIHIRVQHPVISTVFQRLN